MERIVEAAEPTPMSPACVPVVQILIYAIDLFLVMVILNKTLRCVKRLNMGNICILNQALISSLAKLSPIHYVFPTIFHLWRKLIIFTKYMSASATG